MDDSTAPARRTRLLTNLTQLMSLVPPRQRRSLGLAIGLGGAASLADIASLVLFKPAIGAVSLGSVGSAQAQLASFIAVTAVASLLRLAAIRQTLAAQYALSSSLAIASFERLQGHDYCAFLKDGASKGFAAFDRLQMLTYQVLAPMVAALSAACSILLLLFGLALIEPWAALFFAVLMAFAAIGSSRWQSKKNTGGLSRLINRRSRILLESRSGFRDVFLTNGQARMTSDFAEINRELSDRQRRTSVAAQSTRHTLELIGLVAALIGLVATSRLDSAGMVMVPALGVSALAAFRLLPHIATLRSTAQLIANHDEVTRDVLDLLRPVTLQDGPSVSLALSGSISLQHVTVRREGRPDPIQDVSLQIPKGMRIGITGISGSGKSTLLDVLASAIVPDAGKVMIGTTLLDGSAGRAWRERIGFVSQNSLLLGANLREAVVFPDRLSALDTDRFRTAIRLAGVENMAAQFRLGLDTPIGEATEQLSGGQRQRLALAHALYRARDLLLLDEATGQLDSDSEAEVIATIDLLPRDLTIVLVSHRSAMFRCCDLIYELKQGKLYELELSKN